MENDFRERLLKPIVMFVGLLVGVGVIAFSISRILLTVPELVATFTALGLASYVLVVCIVIGLRPKITPRALGAGVFVALVALAGAGLVSAQAGMRDLHEEDGGGGEEAQGEEAAEEGGEGAVTEVPADAALFVAADIEFTQAPSSIPAGGAEIALQNDGNLEHNVVFDDTGDIIQAQAGEIAVGTVDLEPGTYRYHCDIPGHEAAMNGEVTVD